MYQASLRCKIFNVLFELPSSSQFFIFSCSVAFLFVLKLKFYDIGLSSKNRTILIFPEFSLSEQNSPFRQNSIKREQTFPDKRVSTVLLRPIFGNFIRIKLIAFVIYKNRKTA